VMLKIFFPLTRAMFKLINKNIGEFQHLDICEVYFMKLQEVSCSKTELQWQIEEQLEDKFSLSIIDVDSCFTKTTEDFLERYSN